MYIPNIYITYKNIISLKYPLHLDIKLVSICTGTKRFAFLVQTMDILSLPVPFICVFIQYTETKHNFAFRMHLVIKGQLNLIV